MAQLFRENYSWVSLKLKAVPVGLHKYPLEGLKQESRRFLQAWLIGRVFGPEFLLKLYLAGALGGSVFYLVQQAFMVPSSKSQRDMDASNTEFMGASGAVRAILMLKIFLFPKSVVNFCIDALFISVPAVLVGIFLIGNDIWGIKKGDNNASGMGSTHLGGVAVAAIAWARIRKGRF